MKIDLQATRDHLSTEKQILGLLEAACALRKLGRASSELSVLESATQRAYEAGLDKSLLWAAQTYVSGKGAAAISDAGGQDRLTRILAKTLSAPLPKSGSSATVPAPIQEMARLLEWDRPSRAASPEDKKQSLDPTPMTIGVDDRRKIAEISVPKPGTTLTISGAVVYKLQNKIASRKAVLLFEFFDKSGERKVTVPGIGVSKVLGEHFCYLNANAEALENNAKRIFRRKLPEEVATIVISVASLGLKQGEYIDLHLEGGCDSGEAPRPARPVLQGQSVPEPIVHDPNRKRSTADLVVASVLDEFTSKCLSHEVQLVSVTQQAWQSQLRETPPDLLLVESCWRGNDGDWGTLTKGSGGGRKLGGLLRYCKEQGIPTVFWNKEDPPHYDKFGPIAAFFDLVITTDVNMVPRYWKDFGVRAHPLSFAAQPKIHRPDPAVEQMRKAVFAGSYYSDKPKRCADFDALMGQLEEAGVPYEIFDRNHNSGIEKFRFPDHYQDKIAGTLRPEEVEAAMKRYKYQINLNSVQDSSTMFARRVYESLASGIPVISNDSVGVREMFGDVVIMMGETSITEQLAALEAEPEAYRELSRRGVRAVMRGHTYAHRMQTICALLGIEVTMDVPEVTLAVSAGSEAQVQQAKRLFDSQTAVAKKLFIELQNFDTAHQYLGASNGTITYAMKAGRDLYAEARDYYGTDRVLKHDVTRPLPADTLEDFLYWGAQALEVTS